MAPTPGNGVEATAHDSPMLLPAVAATAAIPSLATVATVTVAAVTAVATPAVPAAVAAPVTVPLCFAEPEDVHDLHVSTFHFPETYSRKTLSSFFSNL